MSFQEQTEQRTADCNFQSAFSEQIPAQIFAAFVSNKGIQHIVDTTFSLLGNPIFVTDSGYHFLARQTGTFKDDGSPFSQELHRDSIHASLQEDQIESIRKWKLDDMTYRSNGVYVFYNKGFETNSMVSFIRVRGSIVAQMMMLEVRPFTDSTYKYFSFLGTILSQELQKDSFKFSLEHEETSKMLFHLLNTSKPNQDIIEQRMSMLRIRLKDRFRIAVICPDTGILTSLQASGICRQVQTIFPGCIYTLFENQLVFLMEFDLNQHLGREHIELLRKKMLLNGLQMGVSNEFSDLTEIKLYYRQANQAVSLALRCASPDSACESLCLYQDYASLDLIDIASHGAELRRFCHPYLELLMEYDRENHTDFLLTLYRFLQSNQNYREASEALFIHKNTLSYRIGKIKEILDDDLASNETIFTLNLSYRILIFLKLFIPSA